MLCFSALGGVSYLFQGVGRILGVLCRGAGWQWVGRDRGVLWPQRCLVVLWCSVHVSVGGIRLIVATGGRAERVLGFWREWGGMCWWVMWHPGSVGGVWWVGGVENVRWGMWVGDGRGLLCGDSGVWADEAPGDDAWVAVE